MKLSLARNSGGDPNRGLECPSCGCRHFVVVKTRNDAVNGLRRRRECRNCGKRITTIERKA